MHYELIGKLNKFENFIDEKIMYLLEEDNIQEILKEIIHKIAIVRAEEELQHKPMSKLYRVSFLIDKSLIADLKELINKIKRFKEKGFLL